jgi:hypothetical protein
MIEMFALLQVTAVPANRRLYRGLGAMVLPDPFWRTFEECQVCSPCAPMAYVTTSRAETLPSTGMSAKFHSFGIS